MQKKPGSKPKFPGSENYPTRGSPIAISNGSTLKVTQTSLSGSELLSLLKAFESDPGGVRFVTQIVEGSTVSLTISPTRAGDD